MTTDEPSSAGAGGVAGAVVADGAAAEGAGAAGVAGAAGAGSAGAGVVGAAGVAGAAVGGGAAGVCARTAWPAVAARAMQKAAKDSLGLIESLRIAPVASGRLPLYMVPAAKITRRRSHSRKISEGRTVHPLANRIAAKMNGLGNEIVVLDLRDGLARVRPDDARAIGRMPGFLFDQLMVIEPATDAAHDGRLAIYNIDGSRAESCGNGTRCVAAFLAREGARPRYALESDAGLLDVRRESDAAITVDMGAPRLDWAAIPLAHAADTAAVPLEPAVTGAPPRFVAVNMGNPHAIFFVDDAAAIDLATVGPAIEHHPLFPARVNASFAQRLDAERILLRVWERGAGATRACGTAACATLVAAARTGATGRRAVVKLPGGDLAIEWREADDHVLMTGPAEFEFERPLDPALLPGAA